MVWLSQDKEATQRLIKETILQLCRVNFDLGGSLTYEVDGIICITARSADSVADDDQLVVKLHERVARNAGDVLCRDERNWRDFPGLSLSMTMNQLSSSDYRDKVEADTSLLRGYLSGQRPLVAHQGRSVGPGTVVPSLIHSAQQLQQIQQIVNKRKAIDENDNPVYMLSKRASPLYASSAMSVERRNVALGSKLAKSSEVLDGVTAVRGDVSNEVLDLHVPSAKKSSSSLQQEQLKCKKCSSMFQTQKLLDDHVTKKHGVESIPRTVAAAVLLPTEIKVEPDDELQLVDEAAMSGDNSGGLTLSRRKQSKPKRGVMTSNSGLSLPEGDLTVDDAAADETSMNCDDSDGQSSMNGLMPQYKIIRVEPDGLDQDQCGDTAASPDASPNDECSGTDLIRSLLQKQTVAGRNGITVSLVPGTRTSVVGSDFRRSSPSINGEAQNLPTAQHGRYRPGSRAIRASPSAPGSSAGRSGKPCARSGHHFGARADLDAGGEWKCPHCDVMLQGFQTFASHCRTAHKRHACPYCLQTFTQRVNRDRHLYNHTGEKPYDCAQCGFGFTRRDALRKHQQRTRHSPHSDDVLLHSNPVTTSSLSTSLLHLSASTTPTFSSSPASKLAPSTCGVEVDGLCSRDEEAVEMSWDMDEGDEEEDLGDEMGLDLSATSNITSTPGGRPRSARDEMEGWFVRNVPSDDEPSPVRSDVGTPRAGKTTSGAGGGKKASTLGGLGNAARSAYSSGQQQQQRRGNRMSGAAVIYKNSTGSDDASGDQSQRSFRCDVCGKMSEGIADFTEHCKVEHRRTPCVYCGRTFSQKGNMERHMRQHTGERPFRCGICSSSYTRKETLKAHISQAHGDIADITAGSDQASSSLPMLDEDQRGQEEDEEVLNLNKDDSAGAAAGEEASVDKQASETSVSGADQLSAYNFALVKLESKDKGSEIRLNSGEVSLPSEKDESGCSTLLTAENIAACTDKGAAEGGSCKEAVAVETASNGSDGGTVQKELDLSAGSVRAVNKDL